MTEAGAVIEGLVAAVEGSVGVYARHLGSGEELAIGDTDGLFPTGSAAKLLVLLAYAEMVEDSQLDPETRVTIDDAYRDARPGSGVLRHLGAGLQPSLQDCATLMMIVSDNVATDLLMDAIGGPDVVNRIMADLGVADAQVTSPTVWAIPPAQFGMASPRGLANAWELVGRAGGAGDRCRAITWRHQQREGFARRVPFHPDAVDFGLASPLHLWSKAGSYPGVSCEAGLFETSSARWVLAVMADGLADRRAGSIGAGPTLRAEVSRAVFDRWGRPPAALPSPS